MQGAPVRASCICFLPAGPALCRHLPPSRHTWPPRGNHPPGPIPGPGHPTAPDHRHAPGSSRTAHPSAPHRRHGHRSAPPPGTHNLHLATIRLVQCRPGARNHLSPRTIATRPALPGRHTRPHRRHKHRSAPPPVPNTALISPCYTFIIISDLHNLCKTPILERSIKTSTLWKRKF